MGAGDEGSIRVSVNGRHHTTITEAQLAVEIDMYLAELAGLAYKHTRRRAHVITGEMRDSVYVVQLSKRVWKVATKCPHSKFEENGTRYQPAHPWFGPGVDQAIREVKQGLGR